MDRKKKNISIKYRKKLRSCLLLLLLYPAISILWQSQNFVLQVNYHTGQANQYHREKTIKFDSDKDIVFATMIYKNGIVDEKHCASSGLLNPYGLEKDGYKLENDTQWKIGDTGKYADANVSFVNWRKDNIARFLGVKDVFPRYRKVVVDLYPIWEKE